MRSMPCSAKRVYRRQASLPLRRDKADTDTVSQRFLIGNKSGCRDSALQAYQ
jgi:hypothetical protein